MEYTPEYFVPDDEKENCDALNFKAFAHDDLDTFFNTDEFADSNKITIAKKEVTVVLDSELLKEYNADLDGETTQGEFSFFVAVNNCEEDAVFEGAVVMYQNRRYEMLNVREDEGVYYVVLGANV